MTRSDIHRPAEMIPEHYEAVGSFDLGGNDPTEEPPRMYLSDAATANDAVWKGAYGAKLSQCDHCGARIRYGAELVHIPTGAHIHVGETCLGNRFERSTAAFQQLRKAAQLQREQFRNVKARKALFADFPRLAVVYRSPGENEFVLDVMRRVERQADSITPRQIAAVIKAWKYERFAPPRVEEIKAPAPQGKVRVDGKIISGKLVEGAYGDTWKITVRSTEGYLVYLTCPKAIVDWALCDRRPGETFKQLVSNVLIQFTADLTVSDSDESFAFAKRPTKVEFSDIANAA